MQQNMCMESHTSWVLSVCVFPCCSVSTSSQWKCSSQFLLLLFSPELSGPQTGVLCHSAWDQMNHNPAGCTRTVIFQKWLKFFILTNFNQKPDLYPDWIGAAATQALFSWTVGLNCNKMSKTMINNYCINNHSIHYSQAALLLMCVWLVEQ